MLVARSEFGGALSLTVAGDLVVSPCCGGSLVGDGVCIGDVNTTS